MILPPAPQGYNRNNEQQTRNLITAADAANLKVTLIEDGYLVANIIGRPAQPTGHSLTEYLDYVLFTLQSIKEVLPASPGIDQWEGSIIYRDTTENGGWLALKPGLTHQILETQGPGQIPQWIDLTVLMDAVFGSAQGDILYRDSGAWKTLSPGTAGYVLTTEGPGANPQWAAGGSVTGANPTATASDVAVNGVSTHFMRADAAPAVQKASSSVFGVVKVDGTTITAASGVITAATATASTLGVVKPDGTIITVSGAGAITVPKASASVFGVVEVDNTTITATGGVISAVAGSGSSYVVNAVADAMFFGDGSDGDVTITTTVTLARDMYYRNLTISGSGVLVTGANNVAYRVFVSGTLDISAAGTGAIVANGIAGIATGGAAHIGLGAGNTLGGSQNAGGTGTAGTGNGGQGGVNTTLNGQLGGPAGTSGKGGDSGANTGGAARSPAASPEVTDLRCLTITLIVPYYVSGTIYASGGQSGCGGGGGAGDGTHVGSVGAGGGSGGGVLFLAANTIARGTNANAGVIQALGGDGGTAGNVLAGRGNASAGGGGSGGGGGWIYLIYRALTGSTITNCLDTTGGNGGGGGNSLGGGSGNGGDGGAPGGGRFDVYNLGAGTQTITATTTAGSGNAHSGTTGGAAKAATAQQVSL